MKTLPKTFVNLSAIVMYACLMPLASHAELTAYESFEDGENGGFLINGWTYGDGNNQMATGTSFATEDLSYSSGSVSITGGSHSYKLEKTGNRGALNSFTFTAQTGDVYFSFLASNAQHFFQVYLSDDADTGNSVAVVFDYRNANDVKVNGRLDGQGQENTLDLLDGDGGDSVWVIGKLSKSLDSSNYNQLSIIFNPTDYNEDWDVTATKDIGISEVDTFGLRTFGTGSNGGPAEGDISYIDEIRIGTTFEHVIPEPDTYALLVGLAGLTFVMLRRRR
tara:strand:- start:891 stop:1724 length:834 start_codon:yes stop_codon:yes gene_type:complete